MPEKVTTKSNYMIQPNQWGPMFSWVIVATCGDKFLTGWCKNKIDLEILRKRVVRKLIKLLGGKETIREKIVRVLFPVQV